MVMGPRRSLSSGARKRGPLAGTTRSVLLRLTLSFRGGRRPNPESRSSKYRLCRVASGFRIAPTKPGLPGHLMLPISGLREIGCGVRNDKFYSVVPAEPSGRAPANYLSRPISSIAAAGARTLPSWMK